MKATVRFLDGSKKTCTILNRENDGTGEYGYVQRGKQRIAVSQSTTIHLANGGIIKEWDEIPQPPIVQLKEEEW